MFHICFAANEPYIKYCAVLITSIVRQSDASRTFRDFFAQGGGQTAGQIAPNSNLSQNAAQFLDENAAQSAQSAQTLSQNAAQPAPLRLRDYAKRDYDELSADEQREGWVFHIFSDFVSDSSREKLANLARELSRHYPCEIAIHICDEAPFKELPKLSNNYLTYFRLLIPQTLPRGVRTALYLDVDMLCCGDLRELFALDLRGKVAGVVKDYKVCAKVLRPARAAGENGGAAGKNDAVSAADDNAKNAKNGVRFGETDYFNAGFMLLNLDEWRAQDITARVFEFLREFRPIWHDQDALNYAIEPRFALTLPFAFNTFITAFSRLPSRLNYTKAELSSARREPVILHIYGAHKAWEKPYGVGKAAKMRWWEAALRTPFFEREFAEIYAKCRQNLLAKCIVERARETLRVCKQIAQDPQLLWWNLRG